MTVRTTLIAATAALAFPAAAQADSIALTTAADRVEEVGWVVTATGQGSEDMRAFISIKPAGATGCGASIDQDPGDRVLTYETAEGAYTVSGTAMPREPGTYLLCGWLQQSFYDTAAAATTQLVVDVRQSAATLKIAGRKVVRRDRNRVFRFKGTSELMRNVEGTVKRVGRNGPKCGASRSTDSGENVWIANRVQGAFNEGGRTYAASLKRPGRYVVCAWLGEGSTDLAPEARAKWTFRVR